MKKVIRLTESDLMRLVKRIIRESDDWSDEDESDYTSTRSKRDSLLSKSVAGLKGSQDPDEIGSAWDEPEFKSTREKLDDLSSRRGKAMEKRRYSDVVKNRPSDFDADEYSSEYDELGSEIEDLRKGYPNLKSSSGYDDFYDKMDKFSSTDDYKNLKSKEGRRDQVRRHLDRDYKRSR